MLAFVGDVEQGRLLGGSSAASVSLDGRFVPALLPLRPLRETLDAIALDGNIGRPG
jgi:hypothetical protein